MTFPSIFRKLGLSAVLLSLLFISTPQVEQNFGVTSVANATGTGGPIVLDGMDPVCHAAYGENTDQYIANVLKRTYDQSTIPGSNNKIAILGISSLTTSGGCGANWTTQLSSKFLTQFTTQPEYEFITTEAQLDTFFATSITSTPPKMIWIPDDWGRSSGVNAKFTANAEKIADFVNSGGGLFTNYNSYGWLTALLPNAVWNNGGCNGGPIATSDGAADFGLTDTMVAACWHGYFTGDVGTLKTLATWRYPNASTSPLVAVSLGGGSVALPSSFTLAISPTSPNAGEDLTITATAQTIAGVPQAGVVVTVTVSAGPDAGQTFTATTNSSGIATITVRTNTQGTAVYTATATVNGVAKTVSATVSWNPPTTTIAPATTTTEPATTTTPAPTTTESPVTTVPATTAPVVTTVPETTQPSAAPETTVSPSSEAPTTTVHDHSSHSHGPLPSTGSRASDMFAVALLTFGVGLLIMAARYRNNEERRAK
jgi:hypothetical protein